MLIGYFKYSDVFAQFVDQIDIFFQLIDRCSVHKYIPLFLLKL